MRKALEKLPFIFPIIFGSVLFIVLFFPKTLLGKTRKCIAYAEMTGPGEWVIVCDLLADCPDGGTCDVTPGQGGSTWFFSCDCSTGGEPVCSGGVWSNSPDPEDPGYKISCVKGPNDCVLPEKCLIAVAPDDWKVGDIHPICTCRVPPVPPDK